MYLAVLVIVEKIADFSVMSRKITIFSGCRFSARKNRDFSKIKHRKKSVQIRKKLGNIEKKSGKIGKNREIGEKIGKQILTLLKYKICIF